jgi:hypothetical protein
MKLIESFTPNSEYTKRIFVRQGNKIYYKRIQDKRYSLFKKFKNATKAKNFYNSFILINPLIKVEDYYLSSK